MKVFSLNELFLWRLTKHVGAQIDQALLYQVLQEAQIDQVYSIARSFG